MDREYWTAYAAYDCLKDAEIVNIEEAEDTVTVSFSLANWKDFQENLEECEDSSIE